jgi:predicted DNA-binding WGR domain protein
VLRRVDSDHRMARFYMLAIERDLFGTVRFVRCWGRIGTRVRELAEEFKTELEAAEVLEWPSSSEPPACAKACEASPRRLLVSWR